MGGKDIEDGLSCFLALIYGLLWVVSVHNCLKIFPAAVKLPVPWSKSEFVLVSDKIGFYWEYRD